MLVADCTAKKLELTELEKFGFDTVRPTKTETPRLTAVLHRENTVLA